MRKQPLLSRKQILADLHFDVDVHVDMSIGVRVHVE